MKTKKVKRGKTIEIKSYGDFEKTYYPAKLKNGPPQKDINFIDTGTIAKMLTDAFLEGLESNDKEEKSKNKKCTKTRPVKN